MTVKVLNKKKFVGLSSAMALTLSLAAVPASANQDATGEQVDTSTNNEVVTEQVTEKAVETVVEPVVNVEKTAENNVAVAAKNPSDWGPPVGEDDEENNNHGYHWVDIPNNTKVYVDKNGIVVSKGPFEGMHIDDVIAMLTPPTEPEQPTEPETKPDPEPTPPTDGKVDYADFQSNQYWSDNMLWAIDKGLISGYQNVKNPNTGKYENLLKPTNHLTEAQFLAVMFRYTDPQELENTPDKDGWWAYSSYVMAEKYNLPTKSTTTNKAHANSPITRGQVAQILASKHFGEVVDERTAVDFFLQNGVSSQKDYDDYNPRGNLSRAHIVTFMKNYDTLVNSGKDVQLPKVSYTDFNKTAYWADNMLWAIDKGIISGYKNVKNANTGKYENLLKPSDSLTEAQFLAVLFRYAKPEEFSKTPEINGWWASTGYVLADKYKIPTTATAYNSKGSNEVMTRGKVAVAIATLHHGRVLSERQAVDFMYEAGISTGYDSSKTTYENFGAKDKLTRAHIVTFIKNYHNYLNR